MPAPALDLLSPSLCRTGVSHKPSLSWLPTRLHHHDPWHGHIQYHASVVSLTTVCQGG